MEERDLTPEEASQAQDAAQRTGGTTRQESDQKPPLFNTWKAMYAFVLILHALVIALLYFFTANYQ